ncbi:unnamed protein product [Somion occarium]|uniref:Uncharacterized protein n=1 Tax=Somion occarium TaxID=3059160 RepID=A0ABP1D1S1_9APHY
MMSVVLVANSMHVRTSSYLKYLTSFKHYINSFATLISSFKTLLLPVTTMSEPAINSRKRTAVQSSSDLPPPRQAKAIRSVSPPLSNISMHRFNYYLAIFAALMFALYTYRLVQWKSDAGGWWNLALGKRQPAVQSTTSTSSGGSDWQTGTAGIKGRAELTVEERINELASALGMPSKDLASAIAGAIREYVPPATLSSISAHQAGN